MRSTRSFAAAGALAMLTTLAPATAGAALLIPPWARKYNANCSMCHSPAVPRLNAKGIQFKWAGYRMPEEIGEKAEVDRIQDYLAARGRFRYDYVKTEDEPTEENALSVSDLSVFLGGAVGKAYGGFLELERGAEGEVEVIASATGVWGRERSYGGLRLSQGHTLALGGGVAGFDRAIGITSPLAFGQSTTAIPFRLGGDLTGAEGFFVLGPNRFSVQVLNALAGGEDARSTRRDVAITNQLLWDDAGGGIGVAAYFGKVGGERVVEGDLLARFAGRPLRNEAGEEEEELPLAGVRYTRLAVTANKYLGDFEVLGGYVFSRDRDLPTGFFDRSRLTGNAWWVSGQYYIRPTPLVLFGRYELLDPDTDADDNALRRFVLGGVMPLSLPEYLRLALEYRLDNPQGAGSRQTNGLAAEFMLTF